MKNNQKFISKIAALNNEFRNFEAEFKKAEKYSYEALIWENKMLAEADKVRTLYYSAVKNLPEDKRDELHAKLEDVYKGTMHENSFKSLKETIAKYRNLPTPESKRNYLFYMCPDSLINLGHIQNFLSEVSEYVDDAVLDKLSDEIDSFESEYTHNVKYYPWKDRIAKIKEQNKEKVADPAKLAALNAELDSIADLIVTSGQKYGKRNGDDIDDRLRVKANKRTDDIAKKRFQDEKYDYVTKYLFKEYLVDGISKINPSHDTDVNVAKAFTADDVKFEFPEEKKDALRKIIGYIKEKGMVLADSFAGEDGKKIFGFRQIHNTKNALSKAIESADLDAIKSARAEYEKALENMRGLYSMVKELINPQDMVGNVNSYREEWVPHEFKNDLLCNAYSNAICNLYTTLNTNGMDLEEFFENPNKAIFKMMDASASHASPNDHIGGKSIGDAIVDAFIGNPKGGYAAHALIRNVEFMLALTYGHEEYERNAFASMLIQTYDTHVTDLSLFNKEASVKGYLAKNTLQTLANMYLVNDKDRDYNKLRAFEAVTPSGMEKIPAFDALDYIAENLINADELAKRITDAVADAAARQDIKGNRYLSNGTMLTVIRGAQVAASEYLMVHPTPDGDVMTKEAYNALKKIVDAPEKAFAGVFDKSLRADMRKMETMKQREKRIATEGKAKLDVARKEAREAEAAYSLKVSEASDDKSALKKLRTEELARLDKAYSEGKLPKDYFEQRRLDVEMGNHKSTVPFGTSECPGFDEFKKKYATELEDSELSNEDVRIFYDRMIESARFEENKFFLIATGEHPAPTLEAESAREKQEVLKESIVIGELKENNKNLPVSEFKKEEPQKYKQLIN